MQYKSEQFQSKFRTMREKRKHLITSSEIDLWAEHEIKLLKRRLDLKQDDVKDFMNNISLLRGVWRIEKECALKIEKNKF